jgi:hypothetical protein
MEDSDAPDIDELRQATAALLADLDGWYEADPDCRFVEAGRPPALG